jgi:O-antigen/teichoic acid export membrane protein
MAAVGTTVAVWPGSRGSLVPFLLLALVYVVSGLIEFLHYFYRGVGRSDLESSITLWQRLAMLGCALLALAWRPSLTLLATAMLLPVVVTFAASLMLAGRLSVGLEVRPTVGLKPDPTSGSGVTSASGAFLRDVFPIGAGIVLSALYFRIDVFLVELWRGTEAVAIYNAVFRLVEALRLFPAAVLAVALPTLCRTTDARPLQRVSAALVAFGLAVTVVLWLTAGWTIPFVYGARYAGGVGAFRILLLAFPLMSLNYALTHQLIGWDRQRAYAVVCFGALAGNVALNTWLIPAFSIEGAAWATCWTEAIVTIGCALALVFAHRRRLTIGDGRLQPVLVGPNENVTPEIVVED